MGRSGFISKMLGFLSLLIVVGTLQLEVGADYNYKIEGSDGSTFILSTSKKVIVNCTPYFPPYIH